MADDETTTMTEIPAEARRGAAVKYILSRGDAPEIFDELREQGLDTAGMLAGLTRDGVLERERENGERGDIMVTMEDGTERIFVDRACDPAGSRPGTWRLA